MRFINIKHYLSNDESALNLCEKEIAEYNCYFDENV